MVIKMKVYYAFKLKTEFLNLYKDKPSVLYSILKSIYFLDKSDVAYGYNLFKQLITPLRKNNIDRNIFIKLHKEYPYIKRENIHYINNFYKDEVSRLIINNYYIKLELDQDFSSFFSILYDEIDNLFVCNFKQTDFFFLKEYLRKELV